MKDIQFQKQLTDNCVIIRIILDKLLGLEKWLKIPIGIPCQLLKMLQKAITKKSFLKTKLVNILPTICNYTFGENLCQTKL